MTDQERSRASMKTVDRPRSDRVARLSVSLPRHTLVQLKIHAAQRETTIRDFVTALVTREMATTGADT